MASQGAQVLTFEAGGRSLAIATADVSEVLAVPRITRVPQAPPGLQGLANLRGKVAPILSVDVLLGGPGSGRASRIIVLTGDEPIGLAVERIGAMRHLAPPGEGEGLTDLVEAEAGATRLLQRGPLIAAAFEGLRSRPEAARPATGAAPANAAPPAAELGFLQFELAGQAYALPLEQVLEIRPPPRDVTALPHADDVMLGVMALREDLLPLVSMRILLGLNPKPVESTDQVVVASLGQARLGLVVDRVRAILRASERDIGAVPSVLNRGAGEARIDAIVRTPGGLVSVLATERIFLEETVAGIIAEGAGRAAVATIGPTGEGAIMEKFVLFRLADETYGLPVDAVREVVRLPETITRVPRAPDFVVGVINHRGLVAPLIDQRRRFGVTGEPPGRHQRIVVASVDDVVVGFIVDAVEQILSVPAEALRAAPDLATSDAPIFDRIATLDVDGRLVLLIAPRQLLDQAERDIVRDVARRSNAALA